MDKVKKYYSKLSIFQKVCIAIGCLLIVILLFALNIGRQKNLEFSHLNSYSDFKKVGNVSRLFLSSERYLYKLRSGSEKEIRDFLNSSVKNTYGQRIFPTNYGKDAEIIRQKQELDSERSHYIYQQKIKGIPIFSGEIAVHLKDKEIYAIDGSILYDKTVPEIVIDSNEAIKIARTKAISETDKALIAKEMDMYVFNRRIIDISGEDKNYLVYRIRIEAQELSTDYSKDFFIDSVSGRVLYELANVFDAINRRVSDCRNSRNCSLVRTEGQPATGIADADKLYGVFEKIYNFYYDNFGRNGVDGNGSALNGNTNMNPVSLPCPNADANWTTITMSFCPGVVVEDIAMHEFTHVVIGTSARLIYQNQSGALNEGIADMYGSAIDGNWSIGEGSVMGIFRSLSNPPSVVRPGLPIQPDRLFSSNYYCQGGDAGGVHVNSGVVNKAYFLMTDGGSFNGCSLSGIGRIRSQIILYQALTSYLRPNSNFRDFYTAMLQACNDKYASESGVCDSVKKALEATELDQQLAGTQVGSKCSGATSKPATCIGAPSTSPIPSAPTSTPTPSPTLLPGQPTNTPTPTGTPTPTARPPFVPIGTATPTPAQYFRCEQDPNCLKSGRSIQLCPLICSPQ